ncbi:glycosyl transferase family 1 [Kyrpidia spormannii]|uniref:Glycosyl transferase family 1 n=1 Tax=Kyrpidia spormannii TaxID=2055160 RepID=A0A2K8N7F0_9BACL|nr:MULTISPECIES: glycosyltransferase family 4 protein [Kyrpidia]ATY85258.1 glycosyl transferase family 1 [Kyrpidia spormannii]MCL6577056.1 glycosyltransferase family 4 protein [Kyrpidia sp.]CAB3394004.1 Glycosyl transferase family 1 [Kyrpidia spormannii]
MKVGILTHSFVDGYNGRFERVFAGGLERYMFDLALLLQDLGMRPEIHQLSFQGAFSSQVDGIDVYGHACGPDDAVKVFEQMADAVDGPVIYASFLWHPLRFRPHSIGICHGINWDRGDGSAQEKAQVAGAIQGALDHLQRIVSVDSHFVTYCRSVCTFNDPRKLVFIPNHVDTRRFRPDPGMRRADQVRVLFPRRISWERGVIPMMITTDRILARHPDVVVEFAGDVVEGNPITRVFRFWMKEHPHRHRLLHHVLSFSEMVRAYQRADIVVIPSIFSEGTSFSCLEALSCGAAVVATDVGGLNDLVIDGYNGLLVPPDFEALEAAVGRCIENRGLRRALGRKARETARAFDRSRWRLRWSRVLRPWLAGWAARSPRAVD